MEICYVIRILISERQAIIPESFLYAILSHSIQLRIPLHNKRNDGGP